MKTLYILRHAQKDESNPDDYEKTLTPRGEQEATLMAQKLSKQNPKIDSILASSSVRTTQTAQIFAKELGYDKAIIYNSSLYMAYVSEMQEIISYTYDNVDNLLVVGHNPGVTALALTLTGFNKEMDMGSYVCIEFDCESWMLIDKSNARFISYDSPM